METKTTDETKPVTETQNESDQISRVAIDIIAIAKKVMKECPNSFEPVFQAIIHTLYKD